MADSLRFDYAGARRAGFTDEQIAQSLAAKRAQGVQVYIDRGEVDSIRSGASAGPPAPILRATPSLAARLGNQAIAGLPFAGSVAGGLLGVEGGPVGMVTGAGIGGALGEGFRQSLTQKNLSPLQMGIRGSEGALGEATAGALGGLARGVRTKFPEVVRTIPVKSKILDQYSRPFRKRVEFVPKAAPAAPTPSPQSMTVMDLAHLLARRGLLAKIATNPKVLSRLSRAISGRVGRQSPRVLAELLRQSAQPDATSP